MQQLLFSLPLLGILLKALRVSSVSIAKVYLYLAVMSVVIVASSTFFPFIGGKGYFFRVCVELALIFVLLGWAFESEESLRKEKWENLFGRPLVIVVSCFVLVYLLASLFAYNSHGAFWSNYERGEGGFQMLHYYIFFLLLTLLFREKKEWRLLFKLSLLAALFMILYGIAAAAFIKEFIGSYLDASGNPWAPTTLGRLFNKNVRFQGSLGNPAYVAPYLMFSIFYALYLWFGRRERRGLVWKVVYGCLAVLFLTFFVLSQTRGAFLGMGAAVFVFLGYLLFFNPSLRKVAVICLAILICILSILFYYRDAPFVTNMPGGRFFQTSFSTDTAQTRFWTWGSAWKGFLERPILGWGPENFSTVFDKHFDPRHFVPGKNTETWFDRAHSVFFDYLAETGILGLLSYLGIYLVFYWQFFRRKTSAQGIESPVQRALLFSFPVGYLVQGIAIFEVMPMYVNLFLFFAFANFALTNSNESTR